MLECFQLIRELRSKARFLILNRDAHEFIKMKANSRALGSSIEVRGVEYHETAKQMKAMDAGIFILKPFESLQAAAPTKFGEFLACGIPCLVRGGLGDVGHILQEEGAGVVVQEWSREGKMEAVKSLLALCSDSQTPFRCRRSAEKYFSLDNGIRSYDRLYTGFQARIDADASF
jgi:hypothetical protein